MAQQDRADQGRVHDDIGNDEIGRRNGDAIVILHPVLGHGQCAA